MMILYNGAVYRCADVSFVEQEKEKVQFLSRVRKRFVKLVLDNKDALIEAALAAAEAHPGDKPKMISDWKSRVRSLPDVQNFIRSVNVRKSKSDTTFILDRLSDTIFGGQSPSKASKELSAYLGPAFVQYKQQKSKEPMKQVGLPEEVIKQLLPKTFAFKVKPGEDVIRELSVFGNKAKTEMAKTEAMAVLLFKWNALVDRLNADLKSDDPFTKLCAIVTSIIVHTGIRPGTEGESNLKDDSGKVVRDADGKPVRVKTVGATGLQMKHIKFIRDDFAELKFRGKAATWNIAELTDKALVDALRLHIEDVRDDRGGEDSAFVTKDGRKISDKDINIYMKSVIGEEDITATDFRKLRATREFYNSLRARKSELAAELRQLKTRAKREMRSKIVNTVVQHILVSAQAAQKAISHSDVRVTIESYISPRVVLEYLTNAGLNRRLEDVVSDSRGMIVRFDPMDFYTTVVKGKEEGGKTAKVHVATTVFEDGEPFSDIDIGEVIEVLEM